MPHATKAAALLAALLLGACASKPVTPPPTAGVSIPQRYEARVLALQEWHSFVLVGRIAVKGAGLSGRLRWQQSPEGYQMHISGPFGAGALAIDGNGVQAHIRGKDIDLVTDTPEAVLARQTGWRLPIAALPYWVLGLPAPQPFAGMALDAAGQPLAFAQAGWQLQFGDYSDATPALPQKIIATQNDSEVTVTVESLAPLP
jgi:outer membrane lipoprotein LolB